MAGTASNKLTADYVYENWKKQSLSNVQMLDYDVLLDYPHDTLINNIEVINSNNTTEIRYDVLEENYDNSSTYVDVSKPFLAYAKNGSVTSDELFYVNYCRDADFEELIKNNLNVTGKIVLCQYGKIFRGNKVLFAEMYGAKGCIIFDDPKRSAGDGNFIYPDGEFLPETGTQRGSLFTKRGDPLTPDYPSNSYAVRNQSIADELLPKIPAQCIGYKMAYDLFQVG